jgi:hypothetical protein
MEKKKVVNKGLAKVDAYRLGNEFCFLRGSLLNLIFRTMNGWKTTQRLLNTSMTTLTANSADARLSPKKKENVRASFTGEAASTELYKLVHELTARFVTVEAPRRACHGMIPKNESFNNTVSWYAPKNKT